MEQITQNIKAIIYDLGFDSATLAEAIGLKESSVRTGLRSKTPPRWAIVMQVTAKPLYERIKLLEARNTILEHELKQRTL
jgi:hypothetical protein